MKYILIALILFGYTEKQHMHVCDILVLCVIVLMLVLLYNAYEIEKFITEKWFKDKD